MRTVAGVLVLLAFQGVAAHYSFSRVAVNGGELSTPYRYVRNISWIDDGGDGGPREFVPNYDVYGDGIRCGYGATTSGPGTQTLSVNAGDEIAFFPTYNEPIYHWGPGLAYLSKPHADLDSYTGDGYYFKIGYYGPLNDSAWSLTNTYSMNFTIPKATPPGDYLMRVEHLYYLTTRWNMTQFYPNCAHINVKGPGGGTPGPMVKFPGAYDLFDEAVWGPWYASYGPGPFNLTKRYKPLGPEVWTGE